ncbi:MAG: fimbrillin family protein [Bacteroidales bacterium]|nr:fimbrillin family protein [Bacteroidales bacterium]
MRTRAIIFALAMAAIAFISACSRESKAPVSPSEEGRLIFTGGMQAVSRTSISEGQADSYPLCWESGDAIGILSYELYRTSNINVKASLRESDAGSPQGSFVAEKAVQFPEGGNEHFVIYYPWKEDVNEIDVDTYGITSVLEPYQKIGKVSNKSIGGNGLAWAMVNVADGQKEVNFTLKHVMSYIRFVINTENYNEGYQLRGISMLDYGRKVPMSGKFSVSVLDGSLTIGPDNVNYHASVETATDNFSEQASGQEVYLTVFPGDYSQADLYLTIKYADPKGNVYNIPFKWPKKPVFEAGTVYSVSLPKALTKNVPSYYEPEEKRNYFGDGYAYGPQNSFFIESKEAGRGLSSLTFDVKMRGFHFNLPRPVYYGWLCSSEDGGSLLQFPDGDSEYREIPDHRLGSDFKVTVQCLDQSKATGHWGVLAIYDEEYNILWSYMIMSYQAGDKPADVEYPGGVKLLDRNLGAAYGNARAADIGNYGNSTATFSWGRKDPFMYSAIPSYSVILTDNGIDAAYAIAHPNQVIAYNQSDNQSSGDWIYSDHRADLWGKEKTVFDPCPEGYRVADYEVLKEVYENAEKREHAVGQAGQTPDRIAKESPFRDLSTLAYKLPDGTYDWWPYSGGRWNTTGSWSNRPGSKDYAAWYWSCDAVAGTNNSYGFAIGYSSSGIMDTAGSLVRAGGRAIRCQKED